MSNKSFLDRYKARRELARLNRSLDLAWRMIVFVIGGTMLGIGMFFLLFPGPGWATIVLGLIVLGSEFEWALRLLEPIQRAIARTNAAARDENRKNARMNVQIALTMMVVFLSYAYVCKWGLTLAPVYSLRDWFQNLI
jgi:uncharacterized protein (TIGR02611 family)